MGHSWIQGLPTPQTPCLGRLGLTFCIIWSSSRRHCTSFFRYCSSFSFTRSSTWGHRCQANAEPEARATLAHRTPEAWLLSASGP